jgi:hypothetical protein
LISCARDGGYGPGDTCYRNSSKKKDSVKAANVVFKYRKLPVVVEAIQWTGMNSNDIANFVVGVDLVCDISDGAWQHNIAPPIITMEIKTLEGSHICTIGDFIIKGVNGEFYPCKPDIFRKTYVLVEE